MSVETRVGLFVLGAAIIAVGFVVFLADVELGPSQILQIDFRNSANLKSSADVRLSGQTIGWVTEIALLPAGADAVARVTTRIQQKASGHLSEDLRAYVSTTGLVGESFVELVPGRGPALADGAIVRGVDSPSLPLLVLHLDQVAAALAALLPTDPEDVSALMRDASAILEELRTGQGGSLAANLAAISDDLRAITKIARQHLVEGGDAARWFETVALLHRFLGEELPPLTTNLVETSTELRGLLAALRPALEQNQVQPLLTSLTEVVANWQKVSQDARRLLGWIEAGQGSLGGFVQDPQVYDDFKELVRDLKAHPWKVFWRD